MAPMTRTESRRHESRTVRREDAAMRPRRTFPIAVLLLTSALAACSGSSGGSDTSSTSKATTTTTTAAARDASPSAGCTNPAAPATEETIDVAGTPRRFLIALPADPKQPAPLVLDLHGLGEAAEQQVVYSKLPDAGTKAGAIVVTPASDNAANRWALPPIGNHDADFMRAILDHVEATRCVDRNREVAAGISNGAALSVGLICSLDGRLAAIYPVAGVNTLRPCATAKPTTIVAFHGTKDGLIPYPGGKLFSGVPGGTDNAELKALLARGSSSPFAGITLQPVETAVAGWAEKFGCDTTPKDQPIGPDVRLRRYGGCTDGVKVQLYTVDGGGHTWPGAIAVNRLGATTNTIDATRIIVDSLPDVARP
jgi:polyhydroxybutyrate depolymerase